MKNEKNIMEEYKRQVEAEEASAMNIPINKDALWERVTRKLDEKPAKKMIVWLPWSIAASVVTLLGLTGFLFLNSNKDVNPIDNDVLVNQLPRVFVDDTLKEKEEGREEVANLASASNEKLSQHRHNKNSSTKENRITSPEKKNIKVAFIQNIDILDSIEEQRIVIKGKVLDDIGLPVAGAEVTAVAGTSVFTNDDGNFEIGIAGDASGVLEFAIDGYETVNLVVNKNEEMNIVMIKEVPEDVVVTGYRNFTREKYVGAADVLSSSKIEKMPVSNITRAIEGAAPGIQITSGSGMPGSGSTVRMRGNASISENTSPLYVVDGKPYSGDITKINPLEVENVTVLKDASATSLYGSRGANGVIVINTEGKRSTKKKKRRGEESISGRYDRGRQLSESNQIYPGHNRYKEENLSNSLAWGYLDQNAINDGDQSASTSISGAPVSIGDTTHLYNNKQNSESYNPVVENDFKLPSKEPLSTFSIDVDNAAYTNIRRMINSGQQVPPDAVRLEEMINFFKYQYPKPEKNKPFTLHSEYSQAPWNPKHTLLKIGLQAKEIVKEKLPASNLVFLIDVSGSMSDANKLPLLQKSMQVLTNQLRKEDRVSIVTYANGVKLVLEPTSGDDKSTILQAINALNASGGTNGSDGIKLAYEQAEKYFIKGGNNRIILATDGDFNIGASSDKDMQTLIESKRKSNIFLTCLGFGMGNYKDSKMEILANKGNGNYAYIDDIKEAHRIIGSEFAGTMFTLAKDVKIQIEFDPAEVQSYRLIGYENRLLKDEDFINDKIDAGELGVGHQVTALYEIIPRDVESKFVPVFPELRYSGKQNLKNSTGELATIKFRYKRPDEDKSNEIVEVIANKVVDLKNASADFKLAAGVAWFGLKLRQSQYLPNQSFDDIMGLIEESQKEKPNEHKEELIELIEKVQVQEL